MAHAQHTSGHFICSLSSISSTGYYDASPQVELLKCMRLGLFQDTVATLKRYRIFFHPNNRRIKNVEGQMRLDKTQRKYVEDSTCQI